MKNNKKIIVIAVLLVIGLLIAFIPKQNKEVINEEVVKEVNANGIIEISKYGNVKINLSHKDVLDAFAYGDILTVSFNGVSVDVPLAISFSDVDSGLPGLFLQMDGEVEETELAINMGNFTESYGIASKTVYEDKSYEWVYLDGMSQDIVFNITLKQKAGYLDEFTIRNMTYADDREDYKDLSDEEFGNFREVKAGDIKEGILYHSSSPINPEHNRNKYVDKACEDAGINVFVDLTDNDTSVLEYEGVKDSYFLTQKYIAVGASMDFTATENKEKLAEALRFMIDNPGKYCIFCDEGKSRTGIVIAILESLMGANYDEISQDYMKSFVNYYGISVDDPVYEITLNGTLNKSLSGVLNVDIKTADLTKAANDYLLSIGLSENEIDMLKKNLG